MTAILEENVGYVMSRRWHTSRLVPFTIASQKAQSNGSERVDDGLSSFSEHSFLIIGCWQSVINTQINSLRIGNPQQHASTR